MDKGKRYNTGKASWTYGSILYGSYNTWNYRLGPCPVCGTPCFDYGGNWRCLSLYCSKSYTNPIHNVGPRPEWWNTDINVKLDGDSWCAFQDGFINLQESEAGFGDSPKEAINELNKRTANDV